MTKLQEMGLEELQARLREFDRAVELRFPGKSFRLVFVGGGAMVLLGALDRPTDDLDVLDSPRELQPLMEEFGLSSKALAYESHFPYHMRDRLVPLDVETSVVECFAASLEDLVASKLDSNRPVDEKDVRRPEVLDALDWDRLAAVVEDREASSLNERRYEELLASYRSYREECGPCDD